MSDLAAYTVIGLSLGGIFALAALGIVLVFRATGVLNFAHGAMGMFSTFVAWQVFYGWAHPALMAGRVGHGHRHSGRSRLRGSSRSRPRAGGVPLGSNARACREGRDHDRSASRSPIRSVAHLEEQPVPPADLHRAANG